MKNLVHEEIKNFDWGENNEWYKKQMIIEFFSNENIYEKVFKVEENDVVMDIGASLGPWSFLLKDRNIKHLYCIEPAKGQIEALKNNVKDIPNTIIQNVLGENDTPVQEIFGVDGNMEIVKSKTFMQIVDEYDIKKIDFLKTDCEGGEYNIFDVENICWLKENMKKCSGEWHLSTTELKQKFRKFRDVFLRIFPIHEVYSVDGVNIKWDLWNEHFIEYYNEVIIHIDNR
jgi:FkbM family methyltransferase